MQPSTGALMAVESLRKEGIGFTICSGRADPGTKPFVEMLKVRLPYIVSGGTAIINPLDNKVIYKVILSDEQIQALVALGLKSGSDLLFHTPQSIYALCSDTFWQNVCVQRWMEWRGWKNVYRCNSHTDIKSVPIIHINFFNREDLLPDLAGDVEKLQLDLNAFMVFSKLEITSQSASKGIALKYLANYLKIPIGQVLTIGDGMNDISMLSSSGVGVAVRNSPPELIEVAGFLAPGNDEGGFASAVDHLLFNSLDELKKLH